MKRKLYLVDFVATAGAAGAIGASLLFMLWTWLFQPQMFGDGQYAMVFLVTSPVGWLLGSVAGALLALARPDVIKPRKPTLSCLGLIIGGAVVSPVPGTMVMMLIATVIGLLLELLKLFRF